jgi:membrane protein DedA with SNARE-associated domain
MFDNLTSIFDAFSEFWFAFQNGSIPSLGSWNYVLLYFFTILQGPTVKLLGGAASSRELMNLYLVFGVSVSASITMDIIWYRIGTSSKAQHLLAKFSKKRKEYISAAQRAMQKNGTKVILIGKFAVGMGVPIHVAAGLSKLNWRKWLPATLIGEGMFTGMVVTIGYLMAESLSSASDGIRTAGIVITILILVGIWSLLPSTVQKMIDRAANQAETD